MKKLTILLTFLLIGLIGKSQDTTYTFVNDTIPAKIVVDTVLFESDIITIDRDIRYIRQPEQIKKKAIFN